MTLRAIVRYPDPRLTLPAQPVTVFDGGLRQLAGDLRETMQAAPGIGITAPHIGVALRVVVLEIDPDEGARTYVNPRIIWASPEMILHREGSVSMPGVHDDGCESRALMVRDGSCRPFGRQEPPHHEEQAFLAADRAACKPFKPSW